jgi:hypothetical protein
LVVGRKPYFSRLSSMFWPCVASPSRPGHAAFHLAAALRDHVEEHAARRHRCRGRRSRLDVVEGVEVVVEPAAPMAAGSPTLMPFR